MANPVATDRYGLTKAWTDSDGSHHAELHRAILFIEVSTSAYPQLTFESRLTAQKHIKHMLQATKAELETTLLAHNTRVDSLVPRHAAILRKYERTSRHLRAARQRVMPAEYVRSCTLKKQELRGLLKEFYEEIHDKPRKAYHIEMELDACKAQQHVLYRQMVELSLFRATDPSYQLQGILAATLR